ncbi:hypothetical protein M8J77_005849 [Diaphorina citri]|nr:hypothetical protein M8J77_005849 [Diaphorina citri]
MGSYPIGVAYLLPQELSYCSCFTTVVTSDTPEKLWITRVE